VENDGKQAVRLLAMHNPDALILDLRFPDTDGAQILAEVRARFPFLPVIILTAYPDSELVPRVLVHSPVVLLAKPTKQKQLLEAVNLALGNRSRRAVG
jgi:DNA-binding NarL/FixJ family response regulator